MVGTILTVAWLAASPVKPQEHALQKGETLETLAAAAYGSRHYAPLLATFNGLKPGAKPKTVTLPTLDAGLQTVGLPREIEGVARLIAVASGRVRAVAVETAETKTAFPTPVVLRVRSVQTDLLQAASGLTAAQEKWTPPKKAIANLEKANELLDALANRRPIDVEAVHEQLAKCLVELIRWSNAGYK